jgi:hypothetical protein
MLGVAAGASRVQITFTAVPLFVLTAAASSSRNH